MRLLGLTKETLVLVGAAVLGVTLVAVMVLRTSEAIFSGSTANPTNNWATGSVSLSDDDANTAMFNATGLGGGNVLTKCIRVTYTGTAVNATSVKLYLNNYDNSGGLAPYLNVRVEEGVGSPGTFADCTGFTGTEIFNNTLDQFASRNAFANGVGSFTPTATNQYAVYRFTITTSSVAGAQSKSAATGFTWEAQG